MSLWNAISRASGHVDPKMEAACISETEATAMRATAAEAFPGHDTWHQMRYPGEVTLPILLLPVCHPLPDRVGPVLDLMASEMKNEGFDPMRQMGVINEQIQAHVWLAAVGRKKYLPIGKVVFNVEERAQSDDQPQAVPVTNGGLRIADERPARKIRTWWLRHVWLRPAYRCQRIFSHSIGYLESWHPQFLISNPGPALTRAFKEHPGHLLDFSVKWF